MRLAGGAGNVDQTSGQELGRRIFAWTVVLALSGCAIPTPRVTPDSPAEVKEKVTAERSQAYWIALSAGNYDAAYGFLSPGSREAVSLERFKGVMQSTKIIYRDVRLDKVTCEASACKTQITITYDHPMIKGVVTSDEQRWIIDNGQAWLIRN